MTWVLQKKRKDTFKTELFGLSRDIGNLFEIDDWVFIWNITPSSRNISYELTKAHIPINLIPAKHRCYTILTRTTFSKYFDNFNKFMSKVSYISTL